MNYENIVKSILDTLPTQGLSGLAKVSGESEASLKAGLTAMIPTILGAMGSMTKDSQSTGNSSLSRIINSVSELGAVLTPAGSKLGASMEALLASPEQLIQQASSSRSRTSDIVSQIVGQLFGAQSGRIIDAISMLTGLKSSSITSLVSLAIPMIFSKISGLLGSTGESVTPSALAGLLKSIAPQVSSALPAGVSTLLSVGSGLSGMNLGGTSASSAIAGIPSGQNLSKPSYAPLLALVALLGGAWYLWSSSARTMKDNATALANKINQETQDQIAKAQQLAANAIDNASDQATAALNAAKEASNQVAAVTLDGAKDLANTADAAISVAKKGATDTLDSSRAMLGEVGAAVTDAASVALNSLALPNGTKISGATGQIEEKLLALIKNKDLPLDEKTWFNFDRLTFETGSATLSPASEDQINNMAAILNAYPTVQVRIGGYTDSTGDANSNVTLSKNRATALMNAIVAKGISANRITAKGYGASHPVASNGTAEGRAQNRRIALLVTAR